MRIETSDILIVGAGACGSLVVKELASRGFSVVVLEAGKRFNPATDLPNTEANAGKIMWAAAVLVAGAVWVNCYNAFDNASPWGGFKQSGWGREKGPYGLDLFTQIKSVIINYT